MRYRKPFTREQRREAVREYESFRENIRLLRKEFAPRTSVERSVFRVYRDRVHAIGIELLKIDSHMRVDNLNNRIELARVAMAEYFRVKQFGE